MELRCIKCGEDVVQRVDLDDGDTITCTGCDAEYMVSDVEELIEQWSAVLPWLRSHPARKVACRESVAAK